MARPARLRIDLDAIVANARLARSLAPASQLLGCVKANAYGHGMVRVAQQLQSQVNALGVACLEEALELRQAGIAGPILLMEGCFTADELPEAAHRDCWTVIHDHWQLAQYLAAAARPARVWIKLDTGMHRLGFQPEELPEVLTRLRAVGDIKLQLMTHFACADETANTFTALQLDRFAQATQGLQLPRSLANSAGLLAWPQSHAEWNRPGFMLYGVNPLDRRTATTDQLQPAMTLTSEVISIRQIEAGEGVGYNHAWRAPQPSRIAVVACGYGDGYPRQTANGAPVWIRDRCARTVGHVAMDMLLLDVTDIASVQVGDRVELWGPRVSVAEVARHSGMSPYELMTRLPGRLQREFGTS